MRFTVTSDQYPYNMAPWLEEKSENVIVRLIEIKKLLNSNEVNKNSDLIKELNYLILDTLFDATKILSFSNGGKWDTTDNDIIFKNLDDGFDEIKQKYGMIEKTKKQVKKETYENLKNIIIDFISTEQYPGRSFLQELFEKNSDIIDMKTIQGKILSGIENNLYLVSNGEKTWSDFVEDTKEKMNWL
ncbi:hypothetical protein AGMMS4952_01140 [Spirochaetia bacterium]|nr:hypothetical protein AGMMS4952_01140 [Spirochaetia bacterium]